MTQRGSPAASFTSARHRSFAPGLQALRAGFSDSAKHYQDAKDTKDYPRHAEDRVAEIAGNVLLHQRNNGGWATNWDPRRILHAPASAPAAAALARP